MRDSPSRVAFDAAGQQLAVAGEATVGLNRQESPRPIRRHELTGHVGAVLGVAFSPDDTLLVSVGRDRSVKVWSTGDGRLLRSFGQHMEAVHAIAFRPTLFGTNLPVTCATGGDDRTVRVWQPAVGRTVRIVRGHGRSVLTLAYAADGRALFTADSDTVEHAWRASDDWIYALAVSPDGKHLATGDWTGAVSLWTPEGKQIRRFTPAAGTNPPP